jgi:hypothetical protein
VLVVAFLFYYFCFSSTSRKRRRAGSYDYLTAQKDIDDTTPKPKNYLTIGTL